MDRTVGQQVEVPTGRFLTAWTALAGETLLAGGPGDTANERSV
jgi:hypothetical protein